MGSDHLATNCLAAAGESGENQRISGVDGLHHSTTKSDSFVIDMERFSHLIEKDSNSTNSRLTRNLSRKGTMRIAERKLTDVSMLATSPKVFQPIKLQKMRKWNISAIVIIWTATFTLEKQGVVVEAGAHDHSVPTQVNHQITITNGGIATTAAAAETKSPFGFRRSSHTWTVDPRRILFFFATLSCMGTILLIYFTLSIEFTIKHV
ncbi:uncharacterized protein LOC121775540 isoform X2 [Salvia splendens]|uniref:uncharacterized protein LOC121775540 isoform X2 n=1 Tax=Salvia splendens TaxID=180675 RepID=UPI001C25B261|nr:uncharacterized protein LOC121775540 isoform X2 [Salvia splendens]